MEKYRKFGDASTGIHPFTVVIAPKPWGVAAAALLLPFRLLFCGLLTLLLLATDAVMHLLYLLYLAPLGRVLLAPLQRLWLRGMLFFAGHVLVRGEQVAAGGSSRRAAAAASSSPADAASTLCAGDVVFANMQSVWDVFALEVALGLPYYTVVFPCPAESGAAGGRCGVKVFHPSPLQRWAVWSHVRLTGTLSYLTALADTIERGGGGGGVSGGAAAAGPDLGAIQAAATTPVFYFAEGTCTNGKGVLTFPALTLRGNRTAHHPRADGRGTGRHQAAGSDANEGDSNATGRAGGATAVAAITYNTPALQNVVSEGESFVGYLFRASKLMYGTTAPAWSSPFFPTALVQLQRTVALDGARRVSDEVLLLPTAAVDSVREAMCMKGGSRLVSAGAGGVRRQPLSVGLREKVGFVTTYIAANGIAKKKQNKEGA